VLSEGGRIVQYDTVLVTKRDTVYLPQNEIQQTKKDASLQRTIKERRLTSEEETHFDKSTNHVSEKDRQDIDDAEANFRQRMRNKMK